jgi:hypothetical protein
VYTLDDGAEFDGSLFGSIPSLEIPYGYVANLTGWRDVIIF